MREDVQSEVKGLWSKISSDNLAELADIKGYNSAFLQIFGFEIPNINYEADVDIM